MHTGLWPRSLLRRCPCKDPMFTRLWGSWVQGLPHLMSGCVSRWEGSTNRRVGESPVGGLLYSMQSFQLSALPLFSLPSFLAQPGCLQAMAASQRFIAYYSRINQSGRWGLSLGIGFCVTGHMPGSSGWERRPPREKATGQASQLRLGPFPYRRRPGRRDAARSQRRLPL